MTYTYIWERPTENSEAYLMLTHISWFTVLRKNISFILFNELWRFLGEIETDNFTVSNSEIITFDFTVSKNSIYVK